MAEETWLADSIFIVDGFFSEKECEKYIQISEEFGYEEALLTSPNGPVRRTDVRNNDRVIFKSHEIADLLWERASDFIPMDFEGRTAIGTNELLRFYRYQSGQQFNWHQDEYYERDNGEKSFWTLMVYLNEDFEGGQTCFEDSYSEDSFDPFCVEPATGTALFFQHETFHTGQMVESGVKYVLRTDVMFSSEDRDDDEDWYDDDLEDEDLEEDENW